MNARIVAFVACRLLALYVLLNYATVALVMFIRAAVLHSAAAPWLYAMNEAADLTIYLVLGVFFWLGAGWIADRVVKPLGEVQIADLRIEGCKALAVSAVGVLCLLSSASMVVTGIRTAIRDQIRTSPSTEMDALFGHTPTLEQILPSLVVSGSIFAVVGVLLIACSGSIVAGLSALRRWGNKPLIDESEQ